MRLFHPSSRGKTWPTAAPSATDTGLSDDICGKGRETAPSAAFLGDHRIVTIAAADWERFEAWAHAPAKPVPALQALSGTPPVWQD